MATLTYSVGTARLAEIDALFPNVDLPSVLETRRATAVQTYAVDGYASIERKGNVDSLVSTTASDDTGRYLFENIAPGTYVLEH